MAAYNITLSDGVTVITVPDGGIYNTYSIPVIGQNATTYGDDMATAQFRHLENFAAATAPGVNVNIPGTAVLTGQLWYDTGAGTLKVWTGSAWVGFLKEQGTLNVTGDILPSVNNTYDVGSTALRWAEGWFTNLTVGGTATVNTLTATSLNGTSSVLGAASATSLTMSGLLATTASAAPGAGFRVPHGTAPSSPVNGDLWTTSSGIFLRLNGTTVELSQVGPASGVTSFNGRTGAVVPILADYDSFFTQQAGTETVSGSWTFTSSPAFNNATPFSVANTTAITNLNADLLDGQHASAFATVGNAVLVTGAQTVAGQKTFTSPVKTNSGGVSAESYRLVSNGSGIGYMGIYNSDDATLAFQVGRVSTSTLYEVRVGSAGLGVDLHGTSDYLRERITGQITWYAGSSTTGTETAGGTQQLGSAATSRLWVADASGTLRNVGFNETATIFLNASRSVAVTDISNFLTKTVGGDVTLTLDTTTMPVGSSFLVWPDASVAGNIFVAASGVQLQWINGNGLAAPTGTRTIARNGIATIRRKDSGTWLIWGTGIT